MAGRQLPVRPRPAARNPLDDLLAAADVWLQAVEGPDILTAADDKLMELELPADDLSVVRGASPAQSRVPVQALTPPPIPAPSVNDMKAQLDAARNGRPVDDGNGYEYDFGRGQQFQFEADKVHGEQMGDTAIAALKTAISVPEVAVGISDIQTGGRTGRALEEVGYDPGQAKAILDTYYSRRQQDANQAVDEADGPLAKAYAALTNPTVIAQAVVESAGPMLAGGAVGRALKVGGAIGEGVVGAGSMAEGVRQQTEDGLLTPGQSGLAVSSGAATTIFGKLGARAAKALGIEDIDSLIAAGAVDGTAQRSLVSQVLLGAFQEGVLEELPQSISEQVHQNVALGRPIGEGVDQAAVMGMLAGAVMGGGGQVVSTAMPVKPAPPVMPLVEPVEPVAPLDAAPVEPIAGPPVEEPVSSEPLVDLVTAADAKIEELLATEPGGQAVDQPEQRPAEGEDLQVIDQPVVVEGDEQQQQPDAAQQDAPAAHVPDLITAADEKVKALETADADADLVTRIKAKAEERRRAREGASGVVQPTHEWQVLDEAQVKVLGTAATEKEATSLASELGARHVLAPDELLTARARLESAVPRPAAPVTPKGQWNKPEVGTNGEWRENPERSSIEVRFNAKPEQKVIDALKAARFRWAKSTRVWYSTRETAHTDVQRILGDANAGAMAQHLSGGIGPEPVAPVIAKPAGIKPGDRVQWRGRRSSSAPYEMFTGTVESVGDSNAWVRADAGGLHAHFQKNLTSLDAGKPKAPVTPQVDAPTKYVLAPFATAQQTKPPAPVKDSRGAHTEQRKAELKAERDEIIGKLKKKYSSPQAKLVPDDEDIVLMAKFVRNLVQEGAVRFEDAVRRFAEAWGEGAADYSDFIEAAWDTVREADNHPDMEPAGSFDEVYNRVKQETADGVENQGSLEADGPEGDRGAGETRPPGQTGGKGGGRRGGHAGQDEGGRPARDGDRGPDAGAVAGTKPARPGRVSRTDRHDFTITEAADIGVGSQSEKLKDNLAAIKALKAIEAENRRATPEEQAALARYVGWGSTELAATFRYGHRHYNELRELLTDEEYDAARRSSLNAHYTSPAVIRQMWRAVERLGFTGGKVLEPSMGVGNFFGLMPAELYQHSSRVGVELDSLTARIAQQLYQGAAIFNKGFEETSFADGSFDLVISNVPFGDLRINDKAFTGARRGLTEFIHDYFLAKSLDKVRPGGVVAVITSHGTLDKLNAKTRRYVASQAEFLGAVRLPMTAFKENAGTVVITDILFLQKKGEGVTARSDASWLEARKVPLKNKYGDVVDLPVNAYFLDHPEMIVGTLAGDGQMRHGDGAVNVHPPADFDAALSAAIDRLPKNVMDPPTLQLNQDEAREIIPAPGHVLPGAFTLKDGKLYRRDGDELVSLPAGFPRAERIKAILPVRDAMRAAMRAMVTGASDAEVEAARKDLNKVYDTFVRRHGFLNARENERAFREDPDSATVTQLEIWDPDKEQGAKADIFTKRTIYPPKSFDKADTAEEALHISLLERGRIDWPRMMELTGKTEAQLQDALLGKAFKTPAGVWQTADEYLSGNVKQKLAEAEAAAKGDESYAVNVEALKGVQPEDIKPTDMEYALGAGWIEADVYESFLAHLLETRHSSVTVKYFPELGMFVVKDPNRLGRNNAGKWRTRDMDPVKLVDHALNSRIPTVRRRDPLTEKSYVDPKATEAARAKLDAIRAEFRKFILSKPELAQRLTDIYNRDYNNFRVRTFDGSHLGAMPGMGIINPNVDLDEQLRPHQKNVIWRILQEGRALMAHEVGAGKTYAMIGAAMEMRRLGLARKPMFVVPNNILQQWRDDILRMYPGAKVLMASEADFKPENRKKLAARVAAGDWDAVLVPQSSFGKIGMSADAQRAFINEQLEILVDYIERAKRESGDRGGKKQRDPSVKQLEAAKAKLETKLKKLNDSLEKDTSSVSFEMLGVDFLFVDEAHEFKNLWFPTKMSQISGVGGTEAGRAQDLFLKVRHLQKMNRNRGLVLATGTPISNTVGEMFTMQRYLMFDELERMGLAHFDAWVQQFATVITKTEWAPTGGFRQKSRLGEFANGPELLTMWRSIADVQTAADLNLPTPKIKGGKQQQVALDPSELQLRYMESLVERAEAIKAKRVQPEDDNMLKVTGDAKKAAIDMRLISPTLPDDPNSRVNAAAEDVYRIWKENDHRRGTQLMFLDMGTPKDPKKAKKNKKAKAPVRAKQVDEVTGEEEELDEVEGYDDSVFNLYADIKKKLVMRGIPEHQVAFIHDAKTHADRKVLFEKMRNGDIRVLLASSMKGGVGMNVQRRLVALHHLDAPWRPLDIAQRNGRILRQGNLFYEQDPEGFEVEIKHYLTKKLFDGYIWQLIGNKQKFITQVMTGKLKGRKFADETGDVTLSADEIIALASGNPLVMERVEVDAKLRRLEAMRSEWEMDQWEARSKVANLPGRIERTKKIVESYKGVIEKRQQPEEFVGTIGGKEFTKREEAGEALTKAATAVTAMEAETTVGAYAGFDVVVRPVFREGKRSNRAFLVMDGEDFEFNLSDSPVGTIRSMELAAASQPDSKLKAETDHLADMEKELDQLQRKLGDGKFEEEDEFQALLARQREIHEALGIGKSDANATDVDDADAGDEGDGEDDDVSAMAGAKIHPPRKPAVPVQPRAAVVNVDQMRPSELVQFIRKEFGTPTRVGKFKQRALGIYKKAAQVIRVKTANDMPTIFHELGHHLQMSVLKLDKRQSKAMMSELRGLGGRTSRPSYSVEQQLDEGTAEFLRIWFEDGAQMAEALAPTFYAEFMTKVKGAPIVWRALQEAQRQWQGHADLHPHERAKAHIDFDGLGGKEAGDISRTLRFQRAWVDDLAYLEHTVAQLAKGKPVDVVENAYVLARLARGATAKAMGFVEHGVRGNDGRFLGISLANAIKDIEGAELEDFATYLVASRVPELHQRGMTGTAMSLSEARGTLAKLAGNQRFEDARTKVYAFQEAMLDYAVENRVISEKQRDAIEEANKFYVPFERVMDGFTGTAHSAKNSLANQNSPFKRIRGTSGRDIINPLETIIKNAHLLVGVAEQNRAMLALVDQGNKTAGSGRFFDRIPEQQEATMVPLALVQDAVLKQLDAAGVDVPANFDLKGVTTIFTPATMPQGKSGVVTVLRDGKREWYQVSDHALYEAIVDMGPKAIHWTVYMAGGPARLLRTTATGTIGFIFRNPLRDTFTAYVQSRYGFRPLVDTIAPLADILGKREVYQQFLASGAAHATLVHDRQGIRKAIRGMTGAQAASFKERMKDRVLTPFHALQALSELTENATRLGEFKLALKAELAAGRSQEEALARAGIAARDVTIDFARGGHAAKNVNELTAFFNARVQGYDRAMATFRREPLGATIRSVSSITALSVALWLMNAGDEEYEKIPEWEKNLFWHLRVPYTDSAFILWPKPFELGLLFGSSVEAFLDYLYKQDPEGTKARVRQMVPGLAEGDNLEKVLDLLTVAMPSALLPALETLTNYDTFRNRHIISVFDEGLDDIGAADLQVSRWTSGLARWLGGETGISPAKLDHIIYGYTTGMGRGTVKALDSAASALGLTERKLPAPGVRDIPLVGSFYRDGDSSESSAVQRLYDADRRARGAVTARNKYLAKGDSERATEIVEEHISTLAAAPRHRAALRGIRALRGEIDGVFANTEMSMTEKRAAVLDLQRKIDSVASDAMGMTGREAPTVPILGKLPVVPRR